MLAWTVLTYTYGNPIVVVIITMPETAPFRYVGYSEQEKAPRYGRGASQGGVAKRTLRQNADGERREYHNTHHTANGSYSRREADGCGAD